MSVHRELLPAQRSQLWTMDVATGVATLVFECADTLFEAPNWSPDGAWLVVNAEGGLYRLAIDAPELLAIPMPGVPDINNDHVVSPDGRWIYVSGRDGHLYEVPWEGGSSRRISNGHGAYKYYLHGISSDGSMLSYVGGGNTDDGQWRTNVYAIPSAGGDDVALTADDHEDDGAEFGADGWLYFNSTRASTVPGHAQLFRMRDGVVEQLTADERVNWFPHPSPDGRMLAYLSYPAGTLGHPANLAVQLRLLELERRTVRTVARIFGGQGSINVPSWSPDSTAFAYVTYPVG